MHFPVSFTKWYDEMHSQRSLMHMARPNISWHSSVLWQRSPTINGLMTQFEELFISKIYESLHAHTPCLHAAFAIVLHSKSFAQFNPALAMHIELSKVGEKYCSHRHVFCARQYEFGMQLRSLSHFSPIFTFPYPNVSSIQLVKLRVDAIRVVSVVTGKKIRLVGEYG